MDTVIVGPPAYSDDWYSIRYFEPDRVRPVVFGASEAAAACGVSPYLSPLGLYLRKRREVEEERDNDAMRMGRALEPVILEEYRQRNEIPKSNFSTGCPMYFSSKHRFAGATPDALAMNGAGSWCVDSKSSNFRMFDKSGEDIHKFGEDGSDQVPIEYLYQAQQQMLVMNLERCDFPVLFDTRTMRTYIVKRNEQLCSAIVSAEKELEERLINEDPPEPNWEHPETTSLLKDMFGFERNSVVELNEDSQTSWERMRELSHSIKKLTMEREQLKNKLTHALRGNEFGEFPDGTGVKRVCIGDQYWTEKDIEKATVMLGRVKRAGHNRLIERK